LLSRIGAAAAIVVPGLRSTNVSKLLNQVNLYAKSHQRNAYVEQAVTRPVCRNNGWAQAIP
jgi:hypothetical protein